MAAPDIAALRDALRDALERRGKLGDMRAAIRKEVFCAMEDGSDAQHPTPPENVVVNELIREYLAFNHYGSTLAVFAPEAGLAPKPLPRSYVASQTHLHDAGGADALPLLYSLLKPPPPPEAAAANEEPPALPPPLPPMQPPRGINDDAVSTGGDFVRAGREPTPVIFRQ